MEPVTAGVVKSVDEIPAVCLGDDLIAIFRLTSREMRLWRKTRAGLSGPRQGAGIHGRSYLYPVGVSVAGHQDRG